MNINIRLYSSFDRKGAFGKKILLNDFLGYELSRKAKVSPIIINRIEKGYPFRVETKRKIIKALGYKLSERTEVFPEG